MRMNGAKAHLGFHVFLSSTEVDGNKKQSYNFEFIAVRFSERTE